MQQTQERLEEIFKPVEGIAVVKQDFRMLTVSYKCLAGVDNEKTCTRFLVGMNGECCFRIGKNCSAVGLE